MYRLLPLLTLFFIASSQAFQAPRDGTERPSAPLTDESRAGPPINDSHFHLTNYVQKGLELEQMLVLMGDRVDRVAVFGIPVQQKWDYAVTGYQPPTYYLHSDARLYYYSFIDAMIAQQYLALNEAQRARFDPMIVGFNPTDGYAPDHIRRVLTMFPGVFAGIGEFSVHKEFVSAKIAGHAASLTNKALGKVLDTAAEIGLLVILHNDIDIPFPAAGKKPAYFEAMRSLVQAHPDVTIIWAHTGLGRVVRPSPEHLRLLESLLDDSDFSHLYFDLSWDEVAKYVVADEASVAAWADLIEAYPRRFLFGSDAVAPTSREAYMKTYRDYGPLWAKLSPNTRSLVTRGNHQRLFDAANARVRAWEAAQRHPVQTSADAPPVIAE
jgi:hypothetical protein